jgi:hypothetical protein
LKVLDCGIVHISRHTKPLLQKRSLARAWEYSELPRFPSSIAIARACGSCSLLELSGRRGGWRANLW